MCASLTGPGLPDHVDPLGPGESATHSRFSDVLLGLRNPSRHLEARVLGSGQRQMRAATHKTLI